MVTAFEATVRQAASDLDELGLRWAMVGGLAVSSYTTPRFTRDVDFVLALSDDAAAEAVIHQLGSRGYVPQEIVDHEYLDRLSTVRLVPQATGVAVDLLFASSGIEEEIVAAATAIAILPDFAVPVASLGHLIALKVLAGRHQDVLDLDSLLAEASAEDLTTAREAVLLITTRGFNRDQDIIAALDLSIALTTGRG